MDSAKNSNIVLRTLKFIALVLITCSFVHCNTAKTKMASSFLKRKYTKGHFFNRVSKVHTDYTTYGSNTMLCGVKPAFDKGPNDIVLKNSNQADNKPSSVPVLFSRLLKLKYGINVARNSNEFFHDSPQIKPGYELIHPRVEDNNSFEIAKPYLIVFLICVAIELILIAIAINNPNASYDVSGSQPPTGCLLLLRGILCGIIAVVSFILFLFSFLPRIC